MSRLIRCNRCGLEDEIVQEPPSILGLMKAIRVLPRWSRIIATKVATVTGTEGETEIFDLCEDCREILVEQFLKGAPVAPITQPLVQTILPHQPMTDCMLVWDPEGGAFMCEHDDSERYHKLCRDQAQNVAEGVPPQDVQDAVDGANEEPSVWHLANRAIIGGHELDGNHLRALDLALSYAADQPQMFAGNEVLRGARSSVHGAILRLLRDGLPTEVSQPQPLPRAMQIEDDVEEGPSIPPQRGWSGDPETEG